MLNINYGTIIDISLPINEQTIIYPGNPAVELKKIASASGSSWHSELKMGTHTGTHIDAPAHVFADGAGVDTLNLHSYIGPCRVLDATQEEVSVSRKFLEDKKIVKSERILLKTKNSASGYKSFQDNYIYLSAEGAQYCAECNLALVGIDYLSVKQKGSSDNRPHTALLENNIGILEGICLDKVTEGLYYLVALPLKIINGDGSPTRAILLQSDES